jgi:hypothetical protein
MSFETIESLFHTGYVIPCIQNTPIPYNPVLTYWAPQSIAELKQFQQFPLEVKLLDSWALKFPVSQRMCSMGRCLVQFFVLDESGFYKVTIRHNHFYMRDVVTIQYFDRSLL